MAVLISLFRRSRCFRVLIVSLFRYFLFACPFSSWLPPSLLQKAFFRYFLTSLPHYFIAPFPI